MEKKLYYLSYDHAGCCGWIGGNAPAYFDDKQALVNEADCKYYFYMAFVNPVNNRMYSVFIPAFS
ncbi:MAG: hypothetical protein LBT26_04150, partial [Clostridiales Family XIII bacterium]|nr:hypothetical protein [Clostridiales Family XIII bacterium]